MAADKPMGMLRAEASHPSGSHVQKGGYLDQLREYFEVEEMTIRERPYFLIYCRVPDCEKTWRLYRPHTPGTDDGRADDIDKGNFHALLAHGKAVHGK
jgi:hypothetical protein